MTIVIREGCAADVSGVLECLAEAFEPYRSSYSSAAFLDTVLTPETITQRMKSMTVLVAVTVDAMIVGTVACGAVKGGEGHLRGMAVKDRWQGTGVASQLLARAEAELLTRGCCRITLDTTLPLQRAIRFYERHGYRRSGKVQDFFGMPLLEYAKKIGP